MESSLHGSLKDLYGPSSGGRVEVTVDGLRIDAVDATGALIEVQLGPLAALKGKLRRLLPDHRVRVVRPIIVSRTIVRARIVDGAELSRRRSPKRGSSLDVFDHLISLAGLFPHPRLEIELLEVEVDEVRVPCRRWPGHRVADRRLTRVVSSRILRSPDDLWDLLPPSVRDSPLPFTTRELAIDLGRDDSFAQRVAYCLRRSGAVVETGYRSRRRLYRRAGAPTPAAVPVEVG